MVRTIKSAVRHPAHQVLRDLQLGDVGFLVVPFELEIKNDFRFFHQAASLKSHSAAFIGFCLRRG